ncbi:MAG: thiol reductant ABC exporter subunit CydD [Devosia sp.]|nr:thiol reductant ABC exporter subunit CydD [Devosia sp.]
MPRSTADNPEKSRLGWLNGLKAVARGRMRLAIIVPLVSGALLLVQVWLLSDAIAAGVVSKAGLPDLAPRLTAFAAILVVRIGLGLLAETAGGFAAEAIKTSVRQSLFAELMRRRLPVSLADGSSGAVAAVLVEQVEGLDGYFSRYLPAMVQASFLPLAFALVLMPVDWVAGLLFLVTAPLVPVFMALVGWGAETATQRQAAAMLRLAGRFGDRLRGMVTLKLFGRAEVETAAIVAASEDLRKRTLGVLRIAFLSSAVLEFFAALGVAGVALYVGLSFLGLVHLRLSPLSFQSGLLLLLMAPEIYQPLRLLAANYHDRATAKAAVAAIAETVGSLPAVGQAVIEAPAPTPARRPIGLALSDLTLRTPGGARVVIASLDLTVPPGQHVALLGDSGGGKSTLLESIARLRDYEGTIRLGDEDLRELDEAMLRQRLALLPQQPRLFHGSIADNICLGTPDATPQAIRAAATRACVTQFADRLPLGLSTILGEGGVGLSGGEVQRVALARIYLRNPDIILLDEPTAHLDRATEAAVLDGLLAFAADRTMLVATHSPAVAGRLERVCRLADAALRPAFAGSRRTEAEEDA